MWMFLLHYSLQSRFAVLLRALMQADPCLVAGQVSAMRTDAGSQGSPSRVLSAMEA